jgi:hypothetical protein
MLGRRMPLIVGLVLLATPESASAVNPASAQNARGQTLTVRIDAPADGARVPLQPLDVRGIATITPLTGGGAQNIAYIVDNSGSTATTSGADCNGDGAANAADDANADGRAGDVLDCEILGIVALNGSLRTQGVGQGAVVAFGTGADQADVSPAAGTQLFTGLNDDASANGVPDIEDVARSVTGSGVGQFTPLGASGGGTDFDAALTATNTTLGTVAGQRNVAYFLSDGQATVNTAPGGPLDAARAAGTRVLTFSVGTAAAGCAAGSSLKQIADTTGGVCTEVQDPSKLAGTITTVAGGATITGLTLSASGSAPVPAPLTGSNFAVQLPANLLRQGANPIAATATSSDGTKVTADVTVFIGAPPITAAQAIGLPSNRRCTSRRAFPIRIRQYAGVRYSFAYVAVNGRTVPVYVYTERRIVVRRIGAVYLNRRRFRAFVDLRGLAKGRYRVRISVATADGRLLARSRNYRTCTRKLRGGIPPL